MPPPARRQKAQEAARQPTEAEPALNNKTANFVGSDFRTYLKLNPTVDALGSKPSAGDAAVEPLFEVFEDEHATGGDAQSEGNWSDVESVPPEDGNKAQASDYSSDSDAEVVDTPSGSTGEEETVAAKHNHINAPQSKETVLIMVPRSIGINLPKRPEGLAIFLLAEYDYPYNDTFPNMDPYKDPNVDIVEATPTSLNNWIHIHGDSVFYIPQAPCDIPIEITDMNELLTEKYYDRARRYAKMARTKENLTIDVSKSLSFRPTENASSYKAISVDAEKTKLDKGKAPLRDSKDASSSSMDRTGTIIENNKEIIVPESAEIPVKVPFFLKSGKLKDSKVTPQPASVRLTMGGKSTNMEYTLLVSMPKIMQLVGQGYSLHPVEVSQDKSVENIFVPKAHALWKNDEPVTMPASYARPTAQAPSNESAPITLKMSHSKKNNRFARAARAYLNAHNPKKRISLLEIIIWLADSPSYIEFCEILESRSFEFDRRKFAKFLLPIVQGFVETTSGDGAARKVAQTATNDYTVNKKVDRAPLAPIYDDVLSTADANEVEDQSDSTSAEDELSEESAGEEDQHSSDDEEPLQHLKAAEFKIAEDAVSTKKEDDEKSLDKSAESDSKNSKKSDGNLGTKRAFLEVPIRMVDAWSQFGLDVDPADIRTRGWCALDKSKDTVRVPLDEIARLLGADLVSDVEHTAGPVAYCQPEKRDFCPGGNPDDWHREYFCKTCDRLLGYKQADARICPGPSQCNETPAMLIVDGQFKCASCGLHFHRAIEHNCREVSKDNGKTTPVLAGDKFMCTLCDQPFYTCPEHDCPGPFVDKHGDSPPAAWNYAKKSPSHLNERCNFHSASVLKPAEDSVVQPEEDHDGPGPSKGKVKASMAVESDNSGKMDDDYEIVVTVPLHLADRWEELGIAHGTSESDTAACLYIGWDSCDTNVVIPLQKFIEMIEANAEFRVIWRGARRLGDWDPKCILCEKPFYGEGDWDGRHYCVGPSKGGVKKSVPPAGSGWSVSEHDVDESVAGWGAAEAVPDPIKTSSKKLEVTYWATLKSGQEQMSIPIDEANVSGPEKEVMTNGMQKVWKWVHDNKFGDRITLNDAYDLATKMDEKQEDNKKTEREEKEEQVEDQPVWSGWNDTGSDIPRKNRPGYGGWSDYGDGSYY